MQKVIYSLDKEIYSAEFIETAITGLNHAINAKRVKKYIWREEFNGNEYTTKKRKVEEIDIQSFTISDSREPYGIHYTFGRNLKTGFIGAEARNWRYAGLPAGSYYVYLKGIWNADQDFAKQVFEQAEQKFITQQKIKQLDKKPNDQSASFFKSTFNLIKKIKGQITFVGSKENMR